MDVGIFYNRGTSGNAAIWYDEDGEDNDNVKVNNIDILDNTHFFILDYPQEWNVGDGENENVSGKSIMGLLMLAAVKGTTIRITAHGNDASQVLEEITRLIDNKFDEE